MRAVVLAVPLLIAAPAFAQTQPPHPMPQMPKELTDPAMAERMGKVAGALTRAIMDMPIGEVEAAVQGRPATPAERNKRVRDSVNDPYLAQRVEVQAAQSGRVMQAGAQAMIRAMPAIMAAMDGVEREVERAVANLPDPTYPRR